MSQHFDDPPHTYLSLTRCAAHQLGMGKECDHLQISALATALNIRVRIVYLDASARSVPDVVVIPEGRPDEAFVTLLYRPGHYDVLYEREPPVPISAPKSA